jgi:hypothetical protein
LRKLFSFLFILILSCSLAAQVSTGNIQGIVVDEEGIPLPGVSVTLTGSLTAPTSVVTNAAGIFRFNSLAPQTDYAIRTELDGFKTSVRENIIINAGVTINITLTMVVGMINEQITVVAPTPVLDTKKTSVGINITRDILQALPSARDPWDIINMTPGVVMSMDNVGGIDGGQQATPYGRGGETRTNYWTMDGVPVSSIGGDGGSATSYFDYDLFEEMNISVGGADVTVQTGGIQINIVTRRGGNRLSLAGRFYLIDPWFQANTMNDELAELGLAGVDQFREFRDYGFNMGIPIIKDKIWLWGAYGVQDIETITYLGAPDDTLLSTVAGKINVQIIPENRLEIFAQGNRKQKWGKHGGDTNPRGLLQRPVYHFGFPVLKVQDEHMFSDDFFLSVKYGFSDGGYEVVAVMDPELENVETWSVRDQIYYGSVDFERMSEPHHKLSAVLDYYNDNLLGASHNIKIGFDLSDRNQAQRDWRPPGNIVIRQDYNIPTIDFDGDNYPDIPTSSNFKRFEFERGDHAENFGVVGFSAFFSDTITFGRLNLIAGLRYDRQHPNSGAYFISAVEADTPQWKNTVTSETTALLDNLLPGFQVPEQDGIDVNGNTYNWEDWSPRLALTMDVFGDKKTIAKLAFSRFGEWMRISEAQRYRAAGGSGWMNFWWQDNGDGMVDFSELYWHTIANYAAYRVFDDAGNFLGDWNDASGTFWGGYDYQNPSKASLDFDDTVDPDVNGRKTTEVLLTLEHELLPDFGIGITGVYRNTNNYSWFLEEWKDTGVFENSGQWIEWKPPPDDIPGIGDTKEAKNHTYYYENEEGTSYTPYERIRKRPDYHEDYYGIDFIARKRLSNRWMMNGSISWSKTGAYYGDQGYLSPNNLWAFEGRPNSTYTADWVIKLSGLWQLPYDINVGFSYKGRSGWPIREYFDLIDYNIPNPKSREQRIYMAKSRSERLKFYHNLSLRVEKSFRLFEGRIYLMADVFNAFNLATIERRRDKDYGNYYIYPDGTTNFVPYVNFFNVRSIINPRVMRLGIRFEF